MTQQVASDFDDRINKLLEFNIGKPKKATKSFTNYNGDRPLVIQNVQQIANWERIDFRYLLHVYDAHLPGNDPFQGALSGLAIALHNHPYGASCLSGCLCHLRLSAPLTRTYSHTGAAMELPDYFTHFWKEYYDQSFSKDI